MAGQVAVQVVSFRSCDIPFSECGGNESGYCRDAIHRVHPPATPMHQGGRDESRPYRMIPRCLMYVHHCVYLGASDRCRDAIHRVLPIDAHPRSAGRDDKPSEKNAPEWCRDAIPAVCEGGRDEAHPYTDPIPAACEGGRDESRPYTLHRKHCLFLYCTLSLSS